LPTPLAANRGLRARLLAAEQVNIPVHVAGRQVLVRVPRACVLRALSRLRAGGPVRVDEIFGALVVGD
jgi:hypothetical protein